MAETSTNNCETTLATINGLGQTARTAPQREVHKVPRSDFTHHNISAVFLAVLTVIDKCLQYLSVFSWMEK